MFTALVPLLLVATACKGGDDSTAESPAPPPPYVGKVGVPVHAVSSNKATANITLNAVHLKANDCIGSAFGCLIFDLTFTSTSSIPFQYSESFVTWSYAEGPDPYSEDNRRNDLGGDPAADYTSFMPPAPLRDGQVANKSTKRGLVISDFNGGHHSAFILTVTDPAASTAEAQWLLFSP
jgi:hypothetical protein